MHLRIGSGGQDCDGRNQDRSKSAHLPHLEVCASPQGLHLSETSAAFYSPLRVICGHAGDPDLQSRKFVKKKGASREARRANDHVLDGLWHHRHRVGNNRHWAPRRPQSPPQRQQALLFAIAPWTHCYSSRPSLPNLPLPSRGRSAPPLLLIPDVRRPWLTSCRPRLGSALLCFGGGNLDRHNRNANLFC